jgi:hypothetical protein
MNGNVKIKGLCFFTSNMERLFAIRRYFHDNKKRLFAIKRYFHDNKKRLFAIKRYFHDNEKRLIIYYILKIQKIISK